MCIISWFPASDCRQQCPPALFTVWLALSIQWPEQEHGMSGVATGGCDDHKSIKERPRNEISAHPTLLLNQQRPEHFIIIIKTHYSQRDFWKEYIYISKWSQRLGACCKNKLQQVFVLHTGTVPFDSVTLNKCTFMYAGYTCMPISLIPHWPV